MLPWILLVLLVTPLGAGEPPKPEKTDDTPAEAPQEKPDEKPAEAPEEKPDEKPDEKPAEEPQTPPNVEWVGKLPWRTIGPASMGGRIVDLAVVESDPRIFYVGTASGGIFKTENRGVTFTPIFDSAGSLAIGDLCVAPSDPNIVWAGTGEHNARNSVSFGDGVYKSTDAGATWQNMGLKESFQIGRIAIHPEDPNVVFVGALGRLWGPNEERGLYRTTDGGKCWKKVLNVDEKTGCMEVVFSPGDPKIMLATMYERLRDAFDGGNPVKRWGPGSGLYRSADGGETWTKVTEGLPTVQLGRIGLCFSQKNPETVFAIVESEKIGTGPPPEPKEGEKQPAFMGISGGSTEKDKKGAKLAQVTGGGPAAKAGLKGGDVVVAIGEEAIDSYEALVAQIRKHHAGDKVKVKVKRGDATVEVELTFGVRQDRNPFAASLSGQRENMQDKQGEDGFQTGGLFKSTDAGVTWKRVNSINPRPFYFSKIFVDPTDDNHIYVMGIALYKSEDGGEKFTSAGRGVHADHHAMWIDPADGRHIVLGCDGGLYVTHDRTEHWEFIDNLPIGQFYHVAVDNRAMYRVYGGLQDNGSWGGPSATRSRTGPMANDFVAIGGGDGFVCQIDPEDPDVVYCEMQYGGITRLNVQTGRRARIRPPAEEGKRYRYNWKTPFALSHHNSRIFYSAGNYVFRSLDRGDKLRRISPEITHTDRGTATALAESPRNPDALYVGTDDGALWVTTNGGHEWTDVTKAVGLPGPRRVSSIEASRAADGRAYVTFDGHYYDDDVAYVFVTEDFGETWKSLADDLPELPARTLREDIENPEVLYLGTEFGAAVSLDRGGSWTELGDDLPPVSIHEFAQHRESGELIAGTHGRGIWILDVSPLRSLTPESLKAAVQLFKPKPAVLWSGQIGKRLFGHKRFVGENPPRGAVIYYRLADKAEKLTLKILGPDGQTARQLKASGEPGLHRVTWDLRTQVKGRSAAIATTGDYRVVLTIGEAEQSATLTVRRDPDFPAAATMWELEEEEHEKEMEPAESID